MSRAGRSSDTGLYSIVAMVAWVVGAAAYAWFIGWLFEVVQFAAARLPALTTADRLSFGEILGHGVLSLLLIAAVAVVGGALAYFSSRRKWDVHGPDWHAIIDHGVADARTPKAKEERGRRERQHAERIVERAGRWEDRLSSHKLAFPARALRPVKAFAHWRVGRLPTGEPVKTEQPVRRGRAGRDWAVRLVAGFNVGVLSALLAVAAAKWIGPLFSVRPWATLAEWVGLFVGVAVFFVVRWLLTIASPLVLPAWAHGLVWVIVGIGALFASAPVGVLVLSGVAVSTFGRRLAKLSQPRTPFRLARSPVLWLLLGITTALGLAYSAMPPVPFPEAVITTPSGSLTGGYLARDSSGVYVVRCTALADATSIGERLQFLPAREVEQIRIADGSYYLDSGQRPSLGRLALHALGLEANPPTLFGAQLRAKSTTCGGQSLEKPTVGARDPSLGAGVIAGPANASPHANDGEPSIRNDGRTPQGIAALALTYQPTLLVTAADRNWPVSVNAVLAEQGPKGQAVCLHRRYRTQICRPTAGDLTWTGATGSDYLQLPVALGSNRSPSAQFQAFLRGQYQSSGPMHQWLADPSRLDPWYSAQIYFYDAGPITAAQWKTAKVFNPNVPSGLIGLEYWFYYPYNYYPLVVDAHLMNLAPIAGDRANIDLHQGDWEHIDVLLNPTNDKPAWLYMARHSSEGQFIPWSSPELQFDGTHPVVQAAFGGHPSYLPGCGPAPRAFFLNASADWLSCGAGRFAFPAASTPLVNIEDTAWACWPGHFGEATKLEVSNSKRPESVINTVTHFLYVAGPRGPLVQAENTGVCREGVPRSAYRRLAAKPSRG